MTTRRHVLQALTAAAAAGALVGPASGQPVKLAESDPQAVALGYRDDATKVDAKKYPAWAAGRVCGNCQLFQGKPTDASAPCGVMGGKLVDAKGWCVAWAKKA